MKSVLLIGIGLFGEHVAENLYKMGHEIMAVDIDEARINTVLPIATGAQIGNSTDPEFLKSLGIDNYDVCIVTIGDNFQHSLETTSLLKELGAKKVISRASTDIHEKFLLRNGADEVIYPEKQLASWAAIRYTSENIFDYIELDDDYSIFELSVPSSWQGKSVIELDVRRKHGISILALKKNGKLKMNITPDTLLTNESTLLVLGENKAIKKCFKL